VRITRDSSVPPQGYRLNIANAGISITAADNAGAFYARMTLRQIARQCGDALPACEIEDHPDFPSRGLLLYISGHKVPKMETLYPLVDEFAEY
jgi:N-acetyl-beta-hexosaminidase